MLEDPLVSVITPLFNAASFIKETIESVQAQTYKNWEMIVIDNLSTDNSRSIVEHYAAGDSRIRLIRCAYNSGSPARPRNVGISNARGDYICFLDADDLWLEHKLEKQIAYLNAHKDIFFLYGRFLVWKKGHILNNKIMPPLWKLKSGRVFYDLIFSGNFIPCLTVIFRNNHLQGYLFDENPDSMEDFDLWLRICRQENVAFLNEPLAVCRVHSASTTASIRVAWVKYLTLLRKWRKEISLGIMLIWYALLTFQISTMVFRKIKDKAFVYFNLGFKDG